jgi:hypothetical protein
MRNKEEREKEISMIKVGLIAYFSTVAYVSVLMYFLIQCAT